MHSHTFFQPWLKAHHTIFHTTKQSTHKLFSFYACKTCTQKLVNQQHLFPFTGTTGGLGNGVPQSKIQRHVFFFTIFAFQPRPQHLLELVVTSNVTGFAGNVKVDIRVGWFKTSRRENQLRMVNKCHYYTRFYTSQVVQSISLFPWVPHMTHVQII